MNIVIFVSIAFIKEDSQDNMIQKKKYLATDDIVCCCDVEINAFQS